MKCARLIGLVAVLLTGVFFSAFAQNDNVAVEEVKYVKVKKPFPNIYVKMDPKSDIIRQGKPNEYLEVLSEGASWLKVKVDGKEGYMESKTGVVVSKKSNPAIIMFLIVVVLMLGCAGFAVFFINRQQQQATAATHDDD